MKRTIGTFLFGLFVGIAVAPTVFPDGIDADLQKLMGNVGAMLKR